MSVEAAVITQAVRAENIFCSDGQGGTGGTDELKASFNRLSGLEGPRLVPSSGGLPDPLAQQVLLHPQSSRHSTSERRARSAHTKTLRGASAPASASSSSSAFRGQVASQPLGKFTALIECCCGETSAIASEAIQAGLETFRITEHSNPLGTNEGDSATLRMINELHAQDHKIHLWGSLPCTAWSTYAELNMRKLGPRFRTKVQEERKRSRRLIKSFIVLANAVTKTGGTWSFEWPTNATGWKLPELQGGKGSFDDIDNIQKANFHGCSLGLRSVITDAPIKKPWTILTNNQALASDLGNQRCRCKTKHA